MIARVFSLEKDRFSVNGFRECGDRKPVGMRIEINPAAAIPPDRFVVGVLFFFCERRYWLAMGISIPGAFHGWKRFYACCRQGP